MRHHGYNALLLSKLPLVRLKGSSCHQTGSYNFLFIIHYLREHGRGDGYGATTQTHVGLLHPLRTLLRNLHKRPSVGLYLNTHNLLPFGILFGHILDTHTRDILGRDFRICLAECPVEDILQIGAVMVECR